MKRQQGFTLIELLFCLVVLGLLGGGGYVIIHFIAKFW
jgi:prepilin-type N-terminal cleavage/methylation domain-containing protein